MTWWLPCPTWAIPTPGHLRSAATDAFTPLALAAQWTSKDASGSRGSGPQDAGGLRLGTAVANIYTRGPALLAMSAATLAGLAPGRFVLGIGVSSPAVVTDWNGIALDRPYQRARDTLHFLRRALAGEKVSMEGETFTINGFRLDPAPVPPPALALAALRPGMIALAAAMSDGAITNWLAPADVPAVRAVAGPDCELIARIFVCPTADAGRGPADRPPDDRRLPHRPRVRRVPRLARPRAEVPGDAGGLGGGRPQGRARGDR